MASSGVRRTMAIFTVAAFLLAAVPPAFAATTEMVSVSDAGVPGSSGTYWGNLPPTASISGDGRFVAFDSNATNLVENTTLPRYGNGAFNIFVRDRLKGKTELVSVSTDGTQSNYSSYYPVISEDGRYVLFYSNGSSYVPNTLIPGGVPCWGLYLRDRANGTTEQVNVAFDGAQSNYCIGGSYTLGGPQASISADGRFVAFQSGGTNLVPDFPLPPPFDASTQNIYVRDRLLATTELVSTDAGGNLLQPSPFAMDPVISADGRFVAFLHAYFDANFSNTMYELMVKDRATGAIERIPAPGPVFGSFVGQGRIAITPDGRYVTFAAYESPLKSTALKEDVYVYDRQTKSLDNASVASDGQQLSSNCYNPDISADGRYIVFWTQATPTQGSGCYVRDRVAGTTELASVDNNGQPFAHVEPYSTISSDGQYVAFVDRPYYFEAYVHDRQSLIAEAGPDQVVEQTSPAGASVTLDASGSKSGCADPLTYGWSWPGGTATGVNPTVVLPAGTTDVNLTVGACGQSASDTVKVTVQDTIAPVTVASLAGTKGLNDWYVSNVSMALAATDSGSGVKEIDYAADGASDAVVPGALVTLNFAQDGQHNVSYYAKDNAGNTEGARQLSFKRDATPPVITASVTPPPNAAGWNSSDVTVTFSCSDALSGVANCPAPVTVTTEGADQKVSGTAYDKAGNSATASVVLNIDKTPPTATLSVDPSILWPPNHKMIDVAVTGGASDSLSGVASVLFSVKDEYGLVQPVITGFNSTIPLEAWRDGNDMDGRHYTISAVITDTAGNRSTVSTEVVVPHDLGK